MKITAYEVRPDERNTLIRLCQERDIELEMTSENLNAETVGLSKGSDGVTTLGQSTYSNEVIDALKENGVKVLAARCVGFDHMNRDYAEAQGFKLCHGSYGPNGVAEFTIMTMLMALRQMKRAMANTDDKDFTLKGKQGRQLGSLTVGVFGTGRIGYHVIKLLKGFGCRIICNDVYENPVVREIAEYVPFDTLLAESDVITLHAPLLPSTAGIINEENIAKMKDGVVLINNARGPLLDIDAVIKALENGKFATLVMDAYPGEEGIIHVPHEEDIVINTFGEKDSWLKLQYIRSFVNVIHTPHMAFFTREAAEQMCEAGVTGIYEVLTEGKSAHELPPRQA